MPTFESVEYSCANQVATISLNRPEARNAFNTQLRQDLIAAINYANQSSDARIVVITGAGKGFCAGHDLSDGTGDFELTSQLIENEYRAFLDGIYNSDKLYISAVNGAAAGIGGALAMCCDFTVMAESAYIYQAFLPVGLVPDGGATWHLARTLGYKRALQIIIEAEKIYGAQCVELGLANKVVPDEELLSAANAWALKLAKGAPIPQRLSKRLLQQAMTTDLSTAISAEASVQDECVASKDSQIAIDAFFAKTKPVFTGE